MKASKRMLAVLLALLLGAGVIHAGVLVSYADTFFDAGDFRFAVTSGDAVSVAAYYGNSTEVTLPAEVNGRAVTGVYSRCFENNASVTSVTLPEGYTSVGAFAFCGCQSLTQVTLPSTLKSIGLMAFNDCAALEDIDLAQTDLRSIGFAAFNNCFALESVIMPDTLTSLGENAFCNCASLSELRLSGNLAVISEYAFYGCSALTDVAFPALVNKLDTSCFENAALTGVFVPDTVTSVGENAFAPSNAIVCFSGSAAAQYCADSGSQAAVVLAKIAGDANSDGKVNVNDVTSIQRHLAEVEILTEYEMLMADVNGDKSVNVSDATMIQGYLAEYDIVFVEL